MIIKTYKAPTFKEAMANAKAELGPDAVLLHESRTKKGGLLGFGGKEIVEVIVAVEEPPQKKPVKRAGTRKGRGRTQATRNPVVSNSSEITTAPADNIDSGAVSPEPVVSPAISRRMAASQYQTAGTQQSVDNAQEKAEKYDAGLNTSTPYFKDIMSKAPDRLNLEEFKKNNLIENWITENPEIRTINDKYKPELDNNGNIIKKCENLVEDIFEAFHGEKECCAGFAHPFYITERTGNVQGVIDEVKYKMGDLLKVTESYHQAYSPELVKNQSEMIEQISKQCEGRSLIPIGGRDNHSSNFMV